VAGAPARYAKALKAADTLIRPLYAAGLTADGTNGEGSFNATVLSNLGLAFSTGWIAGDNATTAATPAYQPASPTGARRRLANSRH
jgi:hypothetical protein